MRGFTKALLAVVASLLLSAGSTSAVAQTIESAQAELATALGDGTGNITGPGWTEVRLPIIAVTSAGCLTRFTANSGVVLTRDWSLPGFDGIHLGTTPAALPRIEAAYRYLKRACGSERAESAGVALREALLSGYGSIAYLYPNRSPARRQYKLPQVSTDECFTRASTGIGAYHSLTIDWTRVATVAGVDHPADHVQITGGVAQDPRESELAAAWIFLDSPAAAAQFITAAQTLINACAGQTPTIVARHPPLSDPWAPPGGWTMESAHRALITQTSGEGRSSIEMYPYIRGRPLQFHPVRSIAAWGGCTSYVVAGDRTRESALIYWYQVSWVGSASTDPRRMIVQSGFRQPNHQNTTRDSAVFLFSTPGGASRAASAAAYIREACGANPNGYLTFKMDYLGPGRPPGDIEAFEAECERELRTQMGYSTRDNIGRIDAGGDIGFSAGIQQTEVGLTMVELFSGRCAAHRRAAEYIRQGRAQADDANPLRRPR